LLKDGRQESIFGEIPFGVLVLPVDLADETLVSGSAPGQYIETR
jgi:hypothetical protein